MSSGHRRYFLAAVGAASLAAFLYVMERRRRRVVLPNPNNPMTFGAAVTQSLDSVSTPTNTSSVIDNGSSTADESSTPSENSTINSEPITPSKKQNSVEEVVQRKTERPTQSARMTSESVRAMCSEVFQEEVSKDKQASEMTKKAQKVPSVLVEQVSNKMDCVKLKDTDPKSLVVNTEEGKNAGELTQLPAETEYKNAESPSQSSTNSEGSADSGRATGGPNCSPFDQHNNDYEIYPVYEFEVPNTLVGLIIGVQGKTISELCNRAQVRMLIRPHHTISRMETHQICSIEGKRQNINKCLHMIRYRFPQNRFPDLNLKPVLPPTILDAPKVVGSEPTALSLPVGVPCEVFVCSIVDAGHFFVQLPTHPTFSSLSTLDYYTMNIYSNLSGIPVLPKPCTPGVVCIAPTCSGWFRAITLHHNENEDTVLVRFADYGGFATLPRTELRQIRSDLTSLPMQAIECYLAHVQPSDGTVHWSQEAVDLFTKLCSSKIVHAELVGFHRENNIPYVKLCTVDEKKNVKRVDQVLLELGYAKPADPAKMIGVQSITRNGPVGKTKKTY
ncbi:unnamed protein product [Bursaphelenchus xylophilus]|uniref:(pine wood nematode) hypothetical protein n=1 Tax=Bursaphelenchus xylophilus TaxID=6326 RepID=A0A1I7ST88_BURXY|nr:unnamed protein product [Bursaphelenchus xylophilus]CAG9108643.1 unnamed protein product [Bursaphelenchus xylophilus]